MQAQPPVPVAALLVYWSVSSLALFTYAGEKMPWLTIHIAMPMILAAGLGFRLDDRDDPMGPAGSLGCT